MVKDTGDASRDSTKWGTQLLEQLLYSFVAEKSGYIEISSSISPKHNG